ncbi:MAG: Ig-like domain-containing protein, partial [Intestinibacter sp.]
AKSFKVAIYDSEDYYDKYRDFDDLEAIEYLSGSSSNPKSSTDRYELNRGTYYIKVTASKGKYWLKASSTGYLKEFRTFTVNTIRNTSTSITGKGLAGAYVKAYVNGKQIGSTVKVKSDGTYKISIPKQKSKTGVIVKMKKSGYETDLEDRVVKAK